MPSNSVDHVMVLEEPDLDMGIDNFQWFVMAESVKVEA